MSERIAADRAVRIASALEAVGASANRRMAMATFDPSIRQLAAGASRELGGIQRDERDRPLCSASTHEDRAERKRKLIFAAAEIIAAIVSTGES